MLSHHFKNYLQSFKPKAIFLYTFLTDAFSLAFIFFIFAGFFSFLNRQSKNLTNGQGADQLKQYILSAPPEQLQALAMQLRTFVVSFIFLTLLSLLLAFVIFTLSQYLIWHFILKKKFVKKQFLKWLLLMLVFLIFFSLALLLFLILKMPFLILLSNLDQSLYAGFDSCFNLVFLLAALFFFFSLCFQFAQTNYLWLSFGHTFTLIKKHFKALIISYLLSFATAIIISLLLFGLLQLFPGLMSALLYLNLLIALLYLAWLRLYFFKVASL